MSNLDFAEMAAHLRRVAERIPAEEHAALDDIGRDVAKAAADKLGTYQGSVGSFPAWAPLAETTKEERVRLGFTPDDPLERDGTLERSIGHDTAPHEVAVGSPLPEALWMEGGTSRAPPRPFLGPAMQEAGHTIMTRFLRAISNAFRRS